MQTPELRRWLSDEVWTFVPIVPAIVLSNMNPNLFADIVSDALFDEYGEISILSVSSFVREDGTIDINGLRSALQSSNVRLFLDTDATQPQLTEFLNTIRTMKESSSASRFAEVILTARKDVKVHPEDNGRVMNIRRM